MQTQPDSKVCWHCQTPKKLTSFRLYHRADGAEYRAMMCYACSNAIRNYGVHLAQDPDFDAVCYLTQAGELVSVFGPIPEYHGPKLKTEDIADFNREAFVSMLTGGERYVKTSRGGMVLAG